MFDVIFVQVPFLEMSNQTKPLITGVTTPSVALAYTAYIDGRF